jgi:guanylate kinase
MSVSATTRQPRSGEVDGKEYFFLSKEDFELKIKEEQFLEHARVFTNLYGTPKFFVEQTLAKGFNILFDIDYQGANQIKAKNDFDVVSLFILPPSIEALKQRLIARGLDTQEAINIRLKTAEEELRHTGLYDYVVINDDLDKCKYEVEKIINLEVKKRQMIND